MTPTGDTAAFQSRQAGKLHGALAEVAPEQLSCGELRAFVLNYASSLVAHCPLASLLSLEDLWSAEVKLGELYRAAFRLPPGTVRQGFY